MSVSGSHTVPVSDSVWQSDCASVWQSQSDVLLFVDMSTNGDLFGLIYKILLIVFLHTQDIAFAVLMRLGCTS